MDLRRKTYSALLWSFIDKGGEQIIRFIFSVVLARLLLPEHFGLIGMAYVVTELARVFVQSGFGLALINEHKATIVDECSVFYFNIFVGFICTILILVFSKAIGNFYNTPQLTAILNVLSLNVFFGSFGTIQTVLMTKRIDFKSQTKVSLPVTMITGIFGIILAYLNFGVWSLVIQTVIRTILQTSLLWFVHSWRPHMVFSFNSLKRLFSFGSKLFMGSIAQMLFGNLYTVLIGKLFSPIQLGYYTRANQTQQLPIDTIWVIIGRVTYPVFSTMKNEPQKMNLAMSKASGSIAYIVFPSLLFTGIIAQGLFRFLFGENWLPSVPMFQILCFANLFYPLEHLCNNVILAKGNASLHFNLQIFRYILTLFSIAFAFKFGINGMLIAFGVLSYFSFIVSSYYIAQEIGYQISKQIKDILPYFFNAVLGGTLMLIVKKIDISSDILAIVFQLISGLITYLFLCHIFKLEAFKESCLVLSSLIDRYLFVKSKLDTN